MFDGGGLLVISVLVAVVAIGAAVYFIAARHD
jgi:hypothetical protein